MEKFLPWFLLFCALGLSGTAAYYSVVGLSVVFIGVAIPVIIMGSFLEISKIAIATYLHEKWKETYGALKIYMTIALVTLSLITSLGIYGLLSTGFQGNIAKLEINEKKIKNVEVKKNRFEEIKKELSKEKSVLDGDITKLRDGLSTNTTTQSVDRRTGQIVTRANNANRQTFENQLKDAQQRRDDISKRIDNYNDSITNLDVQILDMESEEISGSELGAIKYVSELLDWDIKRTANLFILILIFVFDPLAITLVIATNQAFKARRKEDETPQVPLNYPPTTPQVTPQVEEVNLTITDDTVNDTESDTVNDTEVTFQVEETEQFIPQVDKDIDVQHDEKNIITSDEKIKNESDERLMLDIDEYFERDDYDITSVDNTINEKQSVIENNTVSPRQRKKLSYLNRDGYGKSLRIDRF